MFARLKQLLFGDQRPIVQSVSHPLIGNLEYSSDDDAWLTNPKTSPCGFGFYISGDQDLAAPVGQPDAGLIEQAAQIAKDPEAFVESVRTLVQSQLQTTKSLKADRDEILTLRVYRVALMWPERPCDGEIELRASPDSIRMWHCAYLGGKPSGPLEFSGLDE